MTTDIKWTHTTHSLSTGQKVRALAVGETTTGIKIWQHEGGGIDYEEQHTYTPLPDWREDIQVGDLVQCSGDWHNVENIRSDAFCISNPYGHFLRTKSNITAYAKVVKP